MVSTVMATVALLRYRHHRLGWLFLTVIATRIALSLGNIARLITLSPSVALVTANLRWSMLWLFSLSLLLFFAALYTPQLWQRRWLVYTLIGVYGFSSLCFILDLAAGSHLFLAAATEIDGQYSGTEYGPLGWAMAYFFNFSWVLQLGVLGYAFAKQPRERMPLLVLLGGTIVSGMLSAVARFSPVVITVAPSVSDVMFVGSLAYLLFRRRIFETTRVAIDLALQHIPQGIAVIALDQTVLWVNPMATQLLGLQVGPLDAHDETQAYRQQALSMALATEGTEHTVQIAPYTLGLSSTSIRDHQGNVQGFLLLARDVTAVHHAEQTLHERQRELEHTLGALQDAYAAQQQLIEKVHVLSMPIIPVLDGVIVVPLIGALDEQWRAEFLHRLLQGIERHRARIALLDLTGLSTLDLEAASVVAHAVQSARLLGADVMLVGVRPETAQALVTLNLDLRMVRTAPTLASALAHQLAPALSNA